MHALMAGPTINSDLKQNTQVTTGVLLLLLFRAAKVSDKENVLKFAEYPLICDMSLLNESKSSFTVFLNFSPFKLMN